MILTLDNPITGILLPSIDVKTYDEPNRKFEEKTVSIWLGFLSFSTREDNTNGINIKSTRYGLTTSVFAENMHALFNYAYNNPENVKKINIHKKIIMKLAKLILGISPSTN